MDEKKNAFDDADLFAELANKYLKEDNEPISSEQQPVSRAPKMPEPPLRKPRPVVQNTQNAQNTQNTNSSNTSSPVYFSNHDSAAQTPVKNSNTPDFTRHGQSSSVFSLNDNVDGAMPGPAFLSDYSNEKVEPDPELSKYHRRRENRRAFLKKQKRKLHINIDTSKFTKNTYIFFAVVIVLSVIVSVYAVFCVNDVLAIMKNKDSVSVSVSEENIDNVNSVIDLLHDYRLINCPVFSKVFIHVFRSDIFVNNNKGEPIAYTQGSFDLNPKMGLEGLLVTLQGEVVEKETIQITFPEGYTIPQIIDKLVKNEICDEDALKAELNKAKFTYSVLNGMPESENIPYRFEGYLFPDTYEFYIGENPNSIIEKLVKNMDDQFTQEMRQRAAELNMSIPEVLTLASIIQLEAANTKQMKPISGILHNRLNKTDMHPLLECNSTQDYITKKVAGTLTASSLHTADYYLQFYDTYSVLGLPIAPIGNPGMDAIEAALYPEKNDYYFFCHDSKGNMYPARNNAEQNANIAKYNVNTEG